MQSTPKELAISSPLTTHHSPTRWWCEPEVAILIVLVAAAYFVRLGDLTLRGEEMRRALIGYEMMETGDWIVPRVQGDPLLSRPPLQNWVIAASTAIFGSREAWVLRLHSSDIRLLTHLLIAPGGIDRGGGLRHPGRNVRERQQGGNGDAVHHFGQCIASVMALGTGAGLARNAHLDRQPCSGRISHPV